MLVNSIFLFAMLYKICYYIQSKEGVNMKLYNIHKSNHFDDLYYEGSSFIVGDKPNKFREEFLSRSCSYLDHILDYDLISKMNDEDMKKLVIFMKTFVSNSIIDFRELILEDVRSKYYKDRPSRYNCMWLTDEESLPFWIKWINDNTSINLNLLSTLITSTFF